MLIAILLSRCRATWLEIGWDSAAIKSPGHFDSQLSESRELGRVERVLSGRPAGSRDAAAARSRWR